jgi:hypothetical protein
MFHFITYQVMYNFVVQIYNYYAINRPPTFVYYI